MNTSGMREHAFTLVELVVAIVILGVLAAMAIPRFSQAAANRDEADLKAGLAVLRTAIELYYDDHGAYPAQKSTGTPAADTGSAAAFIRQLTQYTDADGRASATPGEAFCHGPYLRHGIPLCPISPERPSAGICLVSGATVPAHRQAAASAGWIYNYETGYLAANSPGVDAQGVRYDTY